MEKSLIVNNCKPMSCEPVNSEPVNSEPVNLQAYENMNSEAAKVCEF